MTAATFATGALICGATMSFLAVYLGRGWRDEASEHALARAERDGAEHDLTIAQNLADGLARGLEYASGRIADRNRHIAELEPLAEIGRRLRARRRGQDAARKVARAAGRGL